MADELSDTILVLCLSIQFHRSIVFHFQLFQEKRKEIQINKNKNKNKRKQNRKEEKKAKEKI